MNLLEIRPKKRHLDVHEHVFVFCFATQTPKTYYTISIRSKNCRDKSTCGGNRRQSRFEPFSGMFWRQTLCVEGAEEEETDNVWLEKTFEREIKLGFRASLQRTDKRSNLKENIVSSPFTIQEWVCVGVCPSVICHVRIAWKPNDETIRRKCSSPNWTTNVR